MDQARTWHNAQLANVRRLAILQTVEEEFVSMNPEQYRDCLSVHPVLTASSLADMGLED
jgi:hypothetical protein